ncbi:MAG: TRAP transporter small permease [Proteobacteria bacterium]|nr:TRAP transporter small permease [Pseudomonadota bacterium]
MKKLTDILEMVDGHIASMEKWLICISVITMISIAFGQVVLRNTLSMGFLWVEHLTRILILWVTFLGASTASREKRHISMDLLTRYVSEPKQKVFSIISSLTVGVCCFLLFMTSVSYIHIQMDSHVSNIWPGAPDWVFLLVIPYFFMITMFRSLLQIKNVYFNKSLVVE